MMLVEGLPEGSESAIIVHSVRLALLKMAAKGEPATELSAAAAALCKRHEEMVVQALRLERELHGLIKGMEAPEPRRFDGG